MSKYYEMLDTVRRIYSVYNISRKKLKLKVGLIFHATCNAKVVNWGVKRCILVYNYHSCSELSPRLTHRGSQPPEMLKPGLTKPASMFGFYHSGEGV